jgi:hypothetical protein
MVLLAMVLVTLQIINLAVGTTLYVCQLRAMRKGGDA